MDGSIWRAQELTAAWEGGAEGSYGILGLGLGFSG